MQIKELSELLEFEHLDTSLRGSKADFWYGKYKDIQQKYYELEERLLNNQSYTQVLPGDKDVYIRSMNSESIPPEGSLIASMRTISQDGLTRCPDDRPRETSIMHSKVEPVVCIAATCEENKPLECEFRAAQCDNYTMGECPQTSGNNRHCMAVLVKVNGLEAYVLLDTDSTTISVIHDFACIAKLCVIQLENPVPLQLGTVGSRSMINFGAKTRLELGPIAKDEAYLNVINIDWYDMIIGTPFMCKHGLVLDFEQNMLSIRDKTIPTLTSGQEDLMLAKKQTWHVCMPAKNGGRPAHAQQ